MNACKCVSYGASKTRINSITCLFVVLVVLVLVPLSGCIGDKSEMNSDVGSVIEIVGLHASFQDGSQLVCELVLSNKLNRRVGVEIAPSILAGIQFWNTNEVNEVYVCNSDALLQYNLAEDENPFVVWISSFSVEVEKVVVDFREGFFSIRRLKMPMSESRDRFVGSRFDALPEGEYNLRFDHEVRVFISSLKAEPLVGGLLYEPVGVGLIRQPRQP